MLKKLLVGAIGLFMLFGCGQGIDTETKVKKISEKEVAEFNKKVAEFDKNIEETYQKFSKICKKNLTLDNLTEVLDPWIEFGKYKRADYKDVRKLYIMALEKITKPIPASDYNMNITMYELLAEADPLNLKYTTKIEHYKQVAKDSRCLAQKKAYQMLYREGIVVKDEILRNYYVSNKWYFMSYVDKENIVKIMRAIRICYKGEQWIDVYDSNGNKVAAYGARGVQIGRR